MLRKDFGTRRCDGRFQQFSDVYLLLLPLCGVWNLQMRRRRKIAVLLVFAARML
ncbi:hypothetical protein CC80DRAFT_494722 [Byssothecium circinans]|uniref:Rhodopsin domain-containing protein n=1 Tax=Byssothecium circinans TaxID=147558 RepID=A0A6A5TL81_9PLEO|nr:hypothetical protein CC80DRAFT_494722 [Byssothecium circinans]